MVAIISAPYALNCADNADQDTVAKTKTYGSVEYYNNDNQKKNGYVVLDFYTSWCHYCKLLDPVVKQMAAKYPSIRFLKVNAESYKAITKKYGVRGFPTVILLKDGKLVKRKAGFMNATKFTSWISPYAST